MGVLTNTVSQSTVTDTERGAKTPSLKSALTRSMATTKMPKGTQATFTPSASVRKRDIANFLGRIRQLDPQTATALEKEFSRKDIFGAVNTKLSRYGMKTNSVTDALTAYLVVAWQAVHGDDSDPPPAQVRAVREQIAGSVAAVPALSSASNAVKQEIADAFLLQALLIDSAFQGAKGRPEQLATVKAGVATGTQSSLGLNLTTLKLTNRGLQP